MNQFGRLPIIVAAFALAACGSAATAAGSSSSPSPSRGPVGALRGGSAGQLVQINGQTLILSGASGDITVSFTTTTTITKTSTAALADITPGVCIVATGAKDASGLVTANTVHHLVERNIFVVLTAHALGRGRENRLGQTLRFAQAGRQRDSGDLSCLLVVFPSGAGEITADHALGRKHTGAVHQHGPVTQFFPVWLQLRGIFLCIRRNQMIGDEIAEVIKPEEGNLG